MSLPSRIAEFGWFGAGWAVSKGGTDDPDFYPPIDDREALRHWLAGFGAAWVECPEGEAVESILNGNGLGKEFGRRGVGVHAGDPAGPAVCPAGAWVGKDSPRLTLNGSVFPALNAPGGSASRIPLGKPNLQPSYSSVLIGHSGFPGLAT